MFDFVSVHFSKHPPRGPARSLFAPGTGLFLSMMLLTGCPQAPPKPPTPPQAADRELHFDKRYLDSLDGPRSARTQREMAIYTQLRRLEMSKSPRLKDTTRSEAARHADLNDSVFESVGGGQLKGYRNQAALNADIYRKIDSLKVLENIPLTPH